jgi:hypothetical protein
VHVAIAPQEFSLARSAESQRDHLLKLRENAHSIRCALFGAMDACRPDQPTDSIEQILAQCNELVDDVAGILEDVRSRL